ncbi:MULTISPECIES: 2-oxo-tetronate isomerase [Tenebrionibacter/Tenebrionicola group]|jgi:PncC family amidohydrolase|uniref:2-oxo-tetronate isomerase n=2 Tax=Tenebrionibacter/Tenebrionicola group TaxID=2969848 RepID=A0A8K0V4E8_9ENTR|nr:MULTISPECIES: 2-oxo-tetronate isomerase [Tenebrionibacter/Tenebrionicola group]MBK4716858.1 2-oxo-tetronate isomerase [Tenebrionibacter intestinalis]MBV5097444.1 2-oxo-tetronate isomerase [Tenebrionicola larvae]
MKNQTWTEVKTTGEWTKRVAGALTERGLQLTTAESCTGGNLAAALCAEAGTAAFYDTGMITFSDGAKKKVLGVQESTLAKYSAVSAQCVQEMSAGALDIAKADIGIAISGYAGPDGGEDGTPAGTVWFAWNFRGHIETERVLFTGESQDVVEKAVRYSLAKLVEKLSEWETG